MLRNVELFQVEVETSWVFKKIQWNSYMLLEKVSVGLRWRCTGVKKIEYSVHHARRIIAGVSSFSLALVKLTEIV